MSNQPDNVYWRLWNGNHLHIQRGEERILLCGRELSDRDHEVDDAREIARRSKCWKCQGAAFRLEGKP